MTAESNQPSSTTSSTAESPSASDDPLSQLTDEPTISTADFDDGRPSLEDLSLTQVPADQLGAGDLIYDPFDHSHVFQVVDRYETPHQESKVRLRIHSDDERHAETVAFLASHLPMLFSPLSISTATDGRPLATLGREGTSQSSIVDW